MICTNKLLPIFGVKTRTVGLYDSSNAYLDTAR